jgi:uncharacterized protein YggT (Ycf19 family)
MNRSETYEPYVPISVRSSHPTFVKGLYLRSSYRWFRRYVTPRRSWHWIPYITHAGKISCHRLISWYCTDEQALASVIATVYQRLLKLLRKRLNRYTRGRDLSTLLKISAYYAITHSDYFLDRALALLGRRQVVLEHLLERYVCTLDDSLWFVYRQVCLQTHWLTFRSEKTRDKSRNAYFSKQNDFLFPRDQKDDLFLDVWRKGFGKAARFLETCSEFRPDPYVNRHKHGSALGRKSLYDSFSRTPSELTNSSEDLTAFDSDEFNELIGFY